MDLTSIFWAALGVVLALRLKVIWRTCISNLRNIPGPFSARFSRLWYFNRVYQGKFHFENIELHNKYGPVVRLAPNLYSISEPDKTVYGIKSAFTKSDWYDCWKHPDPKMFNLFADRDVKRHAETRRKFQSMYSLSTLKSYEPYVDECAEILKERLNEAASGVQTGSWGGVLDIGHWMQCYAFDVIGNITYSERFGVLDTGKDTHGIFRALDQTLLYGAMAGVYAWLHPVIYHLAQYIPGSGASARGFLIGLVRSRMEERRSHRAEKRAASVSLERDDAKPQDFLDKISDAHERDPTNVTPYHVFMMGFGNVVAGSDTTGISLSSILFHLTKWPRTMKALRAEIQAYQTSTGKRALAFEDCQQLVYLQAVIKEGLRMHPATGLPMWRTVPKGGAEIQGVFFPGGAVVGLNCWTAHYNEEVFGNAREFRSERWLGKTPHGPERMKLMESYFIPVSNVIYPACVAPLLTI